MSIPLQDFVSQKWNSFRQLFEQNYIEKQVFNGTFTLIVKKNHCGGRLSFKTQLKIEYLLPCTGSRKVLENNPAFLFWKFRFFKKKFGQKRAISIDISYTLDRASNYSAIQKLKPWLQTQDIPMKWEDSYVFYFLRRLSSPCTKLLAARCECLHLIN
jgi:hypothetical protein